MIARSLPRPLAAACAVLLPNLLVAQLLDYAPTAPEVVLDTDSTVIQPTTGPPVTVVGGVFVFRNVTISAGVLVRGFGSRPMIWVVDNMTVGGLLTVSGGDGERVNTLNSANIPSLGGAGGAAGGAGGKGSPQISQRTFAGGAGEGPGRTPGVGGTGGLIGMNLVAPIGRGSGGGGGAFATQGDPFYPVVWASGTSFVQQLGGGGFGGNGLSGSAGRTLPGGGPGGSPFADGDDDNDFFGVGFDVFRQRVVQGELPFPVGGSGGGGGGDLAQSPGFLSPNWVSDAKGGGGGGGGGCLIVFATTSITVLPTGRITANGGNGGGGEQAGSSNQGGGGGGGSGGMLLLASPGVITLHVKGNTFANNDYDTVLSADGGVTTTGTFGAPVVTGKYPPNGIAIPGTFGTSYDAAPLGGFGGMGIVELATRPGNNADGTNTVLDDNVVLMQNGAPLTGAAKQQFLAWRGFKNVAGVRVDDFGVPTNIGSNLGDIKPPPVLLPLR